MELTGYISPTSASWLQRNSVQVSFLCNTANSIIIARYCCCFSNLPFKNISFRPSFPFRIQIQMLLKASSRALFLLNSGVQPPALARSLFVSSSSCTRRESCGAPRGIGCWPIPIGRGCMGPPAGAYWPCRAIPWEPWPAPCHRQALDLQCGMCALFDYLKKKSS